MGETPASLKGGSFPRFSLTPLDPNAMLLGTPLTHRPHEKILSPPRDREMSIGAPSLPAPSNVSLAAFAHLGLASQHPSPSTRILEESSLPPARASPPSAGAGAGHMTRRARRARRRAALESSSSDDDDNAQSIDKEEGSEEEEGKRGLVAAPEALRTQRPSAAAVGRRRRVLLDSSSEDEGERLVNMELDGEWTRRQGPRPSTSTEAAQTRPRAGSALSSRQLARAAVRGYLEVRGWGFPLPRHMHLQLYHSQRSVSSLG